MWRLLSSLRIVKTSFGGFVFYARKLSWFSTSVVRRRSFGKRVLSVIVAPATAVDTGGRSQVRLGVIFRG